MITLHGFGRIFPRAGGVQSKCAGGLTPMRRDHHDSGVGRPQARPLLGERSRRPGRIEEVNVSDFEEVRLAPHLHDVRG
jgi:hypothetical protein